MYQAQGPKRRRSATTLPQQLDGDACREAISFLVHSPDEASVFQKMKMTFQHRQDLVHDPQRSTDVFKTFPRFLDIKGLVSCIFLLFKLKSLISRVLWDVSHENTQFSWLIYSLYSFFFQNLYSDLNWFNIPHTDIKNH